MEMPVCHFCRNERYDEDMGACVLEIACEDCMETRNACDRCHRAAECKAEVEGFFEEIDPYRDPSEDLNEDRVLNTYRE